MSDQSQGPEWWIASNGKRYPPQSFPVEDTPPGPPKRSANPLATVAVLLGIAALLLFPTLYGGLVLGILAVVAGASSRGQEPRTAKSWAGIVMGVIAIVAGFLLLLMMSSSSLYGGV